VKPPASSPFCRQPVTLCWDAFVLFSAVCALHVAQRKRAPKTIDKTQRECSLWLCMVGRPPVQQYSQGEPRVHTVNKGDSAKPCNRRTTRKRNRHLRHPFKLVGQPYKFLQDARAQKKGPTTLLRSECRPHCQRGKTTMPWKKLRDAVN